MATALASTTRELLAAARGGDHGAFGHLIEPYRAQLYAHCYRMLGSPYDAEDALQDVWLRTWRGLAGFDPRRPLRPWLYRVATNVCIDLIQRRPKRTLPIDAGSPARAGELTAEPQAYVDAWERRDVDAILALLVEDATLSMPPSRSWWRGRDAIAAYLRRTLPGCPDTRHLPTWANGQPAIAWYLWDAEQGRHVAVSIDVPALEGAFVRDIVAFIAPGLFPRFGLPSELPASTPQH